MLAVGTNCSCKTPETEKPEQQVQTCKFLFASLWGVRLSPPMPHFDTVNITPIFAINQKGIFKIFIRPKRNKVHFAGGLSQYAPAGCHSYKLFIRWESEAGSQQVCCSNRRRPWGRTIKSKQGSYCTARNTLGLPTSHQHGAQIPVPPWRQPLFCTLSSPRVKRMRGNSRWKPACWGLVTQLDNSTYSVL